MMIRHTGVAGRLRSDGNHSRLNIPPSLVASQMTHTACALRSFNQRPLDDSATVHFVVGTGRSGTTIVARALGRHPDLLFVDEPRFPSDILLALALNHIDLREMQRRLAIDTDGSGKEPMKFQRRMREHYGQRLGESGLRGIRLAVIESCLAFANTLPEGLDARLCHLGRVMKVIASRIAPWTGTANWLVKQPDLCVDLNYFVRALPNAVFIHAIRDPLDVLASRLDRGFQDSFEAAFIVWRTRLEHVFEFARRYPRRVHHVRLEDFIATPERRLSEMYDLIGMPSASCAHDVSYALGHVGRGIGRFSSDQRARVRRVCVALPEMCSLYPDSC